MRELKPGDIEFTLPLDSSINTLKVRLLKCYRNFKGPDVLVRKCISKRNANAIDADELLDHLFIALSDRGKINNVYFSLVNAESCDEDGVLKYGWLAESDLLCQ
jgi:hypothetical protein